MVFDVDALTPRTTQISNIHDRGLTMIGVLVEFPVGLAAWEIGVVTQYDERTGTITVTTKDGQKFKGCESQVSNVED